MQILHSLQQPESATEFNFYPEKQIENRFFFRQTKRLLYIFAPQENSRISNIDRSVYSAKYKH